MASFGGRLSVGCLGRVFFALVHYHLEALSADYFCGFGGGRCGDEQMGGGSGSSGGGVDFESIEGRSRHAWGWRERQGGSMWAAMACRATGYAPPECGRTARAAPATLGLYFA